MSGNSFGKLFVVTSFGESHGPAIGCIVDGCPPGLALTSYCQIWCLGIKSSGDLLI